MKHIFYLCIGLFFVTTLSSCANVKQLRLHKERIDKLAYGDSSPQEKFDGLGDEMVNVIDASLSRPTVVGTYKHANKFSQQNDKALGVLYQELDVWQSNMSGFERTKFGAHSLTKGYTRKLVTKIPKFKKRLGGKYKQLAFMAKALTLFKGGKKE